MHSLGSFFGGGNCTGTARRNSHVKTSQIGSAPEEILSVNKGDPMRTRSREPEEHGKNEYKECSVTMLENSQTVFFFFYGIR